MKAAILRELDKPLEIIEASEPELIPNGVKIKVLSSHVLSFTKEVFSGKRIIPPVPYIPGPSAIGIIEAVADNVFGLSAGQQVFCDPRYQSALNSTHNDGILIGWFGLEPDADPLLKLWKNGSFAEKAVYPAECVTPINNNAKVDPGQLIALNLLAVAYGAILNSGLKPSQTVIVNGATGNIGACAVILSLAMGAHKVIAVGRDDETLNRLKLIDNRIKPYVLKEDWQENAKCISELAERRDILIDVSAADTACPTLSCIQALSKNGVAVFTGGVAADISLPYHLFVQKQLTIKGSYMYPRTAPAELLRLIENKQIDLDWFKMNTYPLERINEAIDDAPHCKGLEFCAVTP